MIFFIMQASWALKERNVPQALRHLSKKLSTERIFERKKAKEIECDEKYMKVGQVRP
jgi:hypothetical protein